MLFIINLYLQLAQTFQSKYIFTVQIQKYSHKNILNKFKISRKVFLSYSGFFFYKVKFV